MKASNNNSVNRALIKHLANAPHYALAEALKELDQTEQETAKRIFDAVLTKNTTKGAKNYDKN